MAKGQQTCLKRSVKNCDKNLTRKITLDTDDGGSSGLSGSVQDGGLASVCAFVFEGNIVNGENGIFNLSVTFQRDSVSR